MLLARHLYRHTPRTAAEVCMIAGVVMSALILLAPDPRVGYLLYPINFFVWAYLLAEPAPPSEILPRRRRRRRRPELNAELTPTERAPRARRAAIRGRAPGRAER